MQGDNKRSDTILLLLFLNILYIVVIRPLKLVSFEFPMKGSEEFAPLSSSQIMRTFNTSRKRRNLKETVLLRRSIITWPTLGKQNK